MSSDGSASTTGTRLRQFGLYRSIDARTEEFLRLSRRRQIRQGCACAAISTAVTVTIVICVIFVYEYIVITERSKNMSQNWHNLMNSSSDSMAFDPQFNDKTHFDSTTVKLIPILLKTLRGNGYINEMSGDSDPKTDATEPYTRNRFPNIKNWIRMPPSRPYAIEYKTSPFVYFKKPTRNIDYYTKTRQIREYQRIMKFIDKMISDVPNSSFMPVKNRLRLPSDNIQTIPMMKKKYVATNKTIKKDRKFNTTKSTVIECNCGNRISMLLSKISECLQKNIPEYKGVKTISTIDPNHIVSFVTSNTILAPTTVTPTTVTPTTVTPTTVTPTTVTPTTVTPTTKKYNFLETTTRLRFFKINKAAPNKISKNRNRIGEPLFTIFNKFSPEANNLKINKFNLNDKTTMPLTPSYVVPNITRESYNLLNENTYINTTENIKKKDQEHSENEHILRNSIDSSTHSFYSIFIEDIIEEMTNTTKKYKVNDLKDNSLELVKLKNQTHNLKGETSNGSGNTIISTIDEYLPPIIIPTYSKPNFSSPSTFSTSEITQKPYIKRHSVHTTIKPLNTDSSYFSNILGKNLSVVLNNIEQLTDVDWTVEEEIEKDDVVDNNYNTLENTTKLNDNKVYNKKQRHLKPMSIEIVYDDVKDDNNFKHLILSGRPSYLEINRNSWKQGETNKYDNA